MISKKKLSYEEKIAIVDEHFQKMPAIKKKLHDDYEKRFYAYRPVPKKDKKPLTF